jgi:Zn-dependent protease with chaperone function
MWDQYSNVLTLKLTGESREVQFDRDAVHIDIPLGSSSPRMVQFETGARFYADDDQTLEALYIPGETGARNPHALASRLERHRHAILLSVLMLVTFLFAGYRYGVPAVADSLAFKLPVSTLETISKHTLDSLDRFMGFRPTTLEDAVRERYQAMFSNLVSEIGSDMYDYRLEFRSFGINAFALPSGVIIVGDELVRAMPNDEAVVAVFSHELAHVEGRHGTRQLLRDAGIAFLIGSAFGDLGAGAGVFASLPKMLMTSGYSRQFETDADLFSAAYMTDRYGSPDGMIQALETLGECTEGMESETLKWISSHPMTQHRIQEVREQHTP